MIKSNVPEDLISIIIPVYNTPKQFFFECLNSVKNQTYSNIEIVVVDDGSNKETADYLELVSKDNIKVFHKERGGVSSARNYGVKYAKGKYICFVDADDIISRYYVQSLYEGIKKYNVSVSECKLEKTKNPTFIKENGEVVTFKKYEGVDIWKNVSTGYCTTKMFDRLIFEDIIFDESLSLCEDALFVNSVLNQMGRCCATTSVLYFYRDNPNSSSRMADSKKYRQAIDVSKKILSLKMVNSTEDNIKVFKDFQAVWELKLMLAIVMENDIEKKTILEKEKRRYKDELISYTKYSKDNRVRLANLIVTLPDWISILFLKMICQALRRKNGT